MSKTSSPGRPGFTPTLVLLGALGAACGLAAGAATGCSSPKTSGSSGSAGSSAGARGTGSAEGPGSGGASGPGRQTERRGAAGGSGAPAASTPAGYELPRPSSGSAVQPPDSATFSAAPSAAYVGVVLARQAVSVAAEADGRLASIAVRVGDTVARGAELATLATEEMREEQAVAQAAVSAARGDERHAVLELERTRDRQSRRERHPELYAEEELASARNAVQEAAAALDSARARVDQEEARLRQGATRLAHAVLRAPIDGRVALRYLDPGAMVHSGTPVVRLISARDFLLRFAVPPEKAGALHAGQAVELRLDSPPLTLGGRISRLAPRLDTASQMIFVDAELDVPAAWVARLQDGLPGRVVVRG
ncbi:MAG TPA: efflux RND transporter periplasmic adaptor subunit [Thermoanaerobaculia bacterium]|nr:efflux RND transporter periplasmic adaptor subunit [Thermoanaerobaculia bacterium]